jgi:hypothetical protein
VLWFHHPQRQSLVTTFLDFLNRLADIKIGWAIKYAPATPHAGDPIKVLRKIIKLVHDSLPGSLTVRWSWVMP